MEKLEKEIISEWEDFYINYKILQDILHPLQVIYNNLTNSKSQSKEKYEKGINNDNLLSENLLSNNEQNDQENIKENISGININDIFSKYFSQLNLEINKFSYFDKTLQEKRHTKRFNEIIQQLNYIENHSTMKMFKEQLRESCTGYTRKKR